MPIQITINHLSDAGDILTVRGTFTLTGNYTAGAGNGETLNLAAATMAALAAGLAKGVPAVEAPIQAGAWPRAGGAAAGITKGSGPNNSIVRFFTAANTELAGAPTAYPAYMLAETYDFCMDFRKLA